MNDGRIVSTDGLDIAIDAWEPAFEEDQVERGPTRSRRGRTRASVYLLGPAARITLTASGSIRSLPRRWRALASRDEIRRNPFWSIAARAVELVHATAEARTHRRLSSRRRASAARQAPARAPPPGRPRRRAACCSTATRSTRRARRRAQIVPPTSQNQAAIEADLTAFAPTVLDLPHAEATRVSSS